MNKNLIILILVVVVIAETGYVLMKKGSFRSMIGGGDDRVSVTPNRPLGGRLPLPTKGTNLMDSPLAKFAYQIAPGDLSADAKTNLAGFAIDKTTQIDGSILVKLTPKDSEDQNQQYIVKPGEKLYFIEQTKADDNPETDKDLNLRDDYGVIVDAKGIIQ